MLTLADKPIGLSATESDHVYPAQSSPLYFISDLHLSQTLPHTVAAFEHFISHTVQEAQALYILGDLFEAWVGDDLLDTPFMQSIAACLKTLTQRGIALYVMHGNRDFLLGQRFAQAARATLIRDPWVIEACGRRIVLTHGDILCTADHAYQRMRKIMRCHAVQCLFKSLPLAWRLKLATRLRTQSQAKKYLPQMDVTEPAVRQLFATTQTTLMIHGHTHRPAQHQHHGATRWVLPDWELDSGAARGGYLSLDQSGIHTASI